MHAPSFLSGDSCFEKIHLFVVLAYKPQSGTHAGVIWSVAIVLLLSKLLNTLKITKRQKLILLFFTPLKFQESSEAWRSFGWLVLFFLFHKRMRWCLYGWPGKILSVSANPSYTLLSFIIQIITSNDLEDTVLFVYIQQKRGKTGTYSKIHAVLAHLKGAKIGKQNFC